MFYNTCRGPSLGSFTMRISGPEIIRHWMIVRLLIFHSRSPLMYELSEICPPGPIEDHTKDPRYIKQKQGLGTTIIFTENIDNKNAFDRCHWQIQGGTAGTPPQQDPFLLFSHTFLLKSVHIRGWHPPQWVGAPPNRKSWIRHWLPTTRLVIEIKTLTILF